MTPRAGVRRYGWFAVAAGGTALAVGLVAPASTAAVPASSGQAVWASTGGGSDNRYWNPRETAINSDTVGRLRERFAITVPHDFPEEPIVAGGKLFVSHADGVTAYSADDGNRLWSHPHLGTSPSLAWMDGTLYASRGNLNRPSKLYAFGPDGKLRWSITNRDVVFGAIVATDGTIAVSGQSRDSAITKTFGFDSSGSRLWTKDGAEMPTHAHVADGAGQIFVRPYEGTSPLDKTIALDLRTGQQRWSIDRTLEPRAAHPEAGAVIAVESDNFSYRLLSLDSRTGNPGWDVETTSFVTYNTAAVDNEHAYQAGNKTGLTARDLDTGELRWKISVPDEVDLGRPIVAGDLVYAITSYGERDWLTAYHTETGERVWRFRIGTAARSNPVIADGSLYLVDGRKIRVFRPTQ